MTLAQATLATEIENLTPVSDAVAAAATLAQAFGDYMKGAVAQGGPTITAAAVDSTAVPAMAAAMSFSAGATAAAGALEVVKGINAFWAAMVAAPAAFFTGATLITPPLYTTTATDLATDFINNTSNSESLEDSASALAATIHPDTDNQGTATFPGPTVRTIT